MKIRAPHSLMPMSFMPAADSHMDSGGFAQNGTPYSLWGVIQSWVSTILREISAYLASVVSVRGRVTSNAQRMASKAPMSINNELPKP